MFESKLSSFQFNKMNVTIKLLSLKETFRPRERFKNKNQALPNMLD